MTCNSNIMIYECSSDYQLFCMSRYALLVLLLLMSSYKSALWNEGYKTLRMLRSDGSIMVEFSLFSIKCQYRLSSISIAYQCVIDELCFRIHTLSIRTIDNMYCRLCVTWRHNGCVNSEKRACMMMPLMK